MKVGVWENYTYKTGKRIREMWHLVAWRGGGRLKVGDTHTYSCTSDVYFNVSTPIMVLIQNKVSHAGLSNSHCTNEWDYTPHFLFHVFVNLWQKKQISFILGESLIESRFYFMTLLIRDKPGVVLFWIKSLIKDCIHTFSQFSPRYSFIFESPYLSK